MMAARWLRERRRDSSKLEVDAVDSVNPRRWRGASFHWRFRWDRFTAVREVATAIETDGRVGFRPDQEEETK